MQKELPQTLPNPEKRFGHTITLVTKEKAVLFGGAVGDLIYRITNDVFSFDCKLNKWSVLRPKHSEFSPSPRAAHGATAIDINQLVIFGGAHAHGNFVDNELYFLKLRGSDVNGKWVNVPVEGIKPSARYGHAMVYLKPYIVVIGGNMGNQSSNEVWMLSVQKSPFKWTKIEFQGLQPSARVYHSACIWKSSHKGDMILVFGGRIYQNTALNDLWGLRRHNNGVWDWIQAPSKNTTVVPKERYQHAMICINDLVIIIGGRNISKSSSPEMPTNVYNLENSTWFEFTGINRFRHVSWLCHSTLYIYGGFEFSHPNIPTNSLITINLKEMLINNSSLLKKIEYPENTKLHDNKQKTEIDARYQLSNDILIAQSHDYKNTMRYVHLSDLPQEHQKLEYTESVAQTQESIKDLYSTVLKYLLKPFDWNKEDNSKFLLKSETIIALCDCVIKVLKQTPTLIELRPGVKIFGSIHGQYGDLMRFFKQHGVPDNDPSYRKKSDIEALDYLFLGNYVDRGTNSLEVICLLLALKLKFPKQIHLLRGSHEDRKVNFNEGLAYECETRLKEDVNLPGSVFNKLNELFEYLPLAALIGTNILCVHSGIGIHLRTINEIRNIRRPLRISYDNPLTEEMQIIIELLWSDPVLNPTDADNEINPYREYLKNDAMLRFGTDRIRVFLAQNDLDLIIRSHECVMDGADELEDMDVCTVFSCTDYGGVVENDAAIFHFQKNTNKLISLTIPYIKGFTKWLDFNKIRKAVVKKGADMKIATKDSFDQRVMSVTPPRTSTNTKDK